MATDATQMRLAGLDGRVALVTGAARGIGRRIAETLSALGARTAGGDLTAPALDGILESYDYDPKQLLPILEATQEAYG